MTRDEFHYSFVRHHITISILRKIKKCVMTNLTFQYRSESENGESRKKNTDFWKFDKNMFYKKNVWMECIIWNQWYWFELPKHTTILLNNDCYCYNSNAWVNDLYLMESPEPKPNLYLNRHPKLPAKKCFDSVHLYWHTYTTRYRPTEYWIKCWHNKRTDY